MRHEIRPIRMRYLYSDFHAVKEPFSEMYYGEIFALFQAWIGNFDTIPAWKVVGTLYDAKAFRCFLVKHLNHRSMNNSADLATERKRRLTTEKRAERTKHDFRCPIYLLCHWLSQLFDLRAPSSTDVPVLSLNQPIDASTSTTIQYMLSKKTTLNFWSELSQFPVSV